MSYSPNNPNGQATMANSTPVVLASDQSYPTLTKGTQGSTGFSVQSLKDAGRVIVSANTTSTGVTAVTTEALLTFDLSRDGAATSSVTSISVTSAKKFVVQSITVGCTSNDASGLDVYFYVRINPSGAVTTASVLLHLVALGSASNSAGNQSCHTVTFPGGLQISGTQQIGISQDCSSTSGLVWASITGYEY